MILTVYYDGLCPLCSREIEHYRHCRGSESIRFLDITGTDFNALQEGVDPVQVHRHLHVKTSTGEIRTGVDAFLAIWNSLPAYQFLARAVRMPVLHCLAQTAYAGFAKIRPYLPRRKAIGCSESPYCERG